MDTNGFSQAAAYMPLFPLVGAAVGLIVGVCVWGLEQILPSLVAATIGVGLLLLINGVQHMDGLLDFGDGLMFHGSRTGKLRVMRDPTTGAGGVALGLVVVLTTVFSLAFIPAALVIPSMAAAESSATFSMVLATATGKSAHKGFNTMFVDAMHRQRSMRLSIAYVIVLAISFVALKLAGLPVVVGSTLTALGMVAVSNRHFGGVTGDVLGATNEIARATSLLLVLVFLKWI